MLSIFKRVNYINNNRNNFIIIHQMPDYLSICTTKVSPFKNDFNQTFRNCLVHAWKGFKLYLVKIILMFFMS